MSGARRLAAPDPSRPAAVPAPESVVNTVILDSVEVRRYRLPPGSFRLPAYPGEPVISVVLVARGGFQAATATGARWQVSAGEGAFLHSKSEYVFQRCDETEAIIVTVPERVVHAFGARVDETTAPVFGARSALLAPVSAYFGSLVAASLCPDRVAKYAMSRLAEEMIGSLFLERVSLVASLRPARVQSPLYLQALALIAARRTDPQLTISVMASELSVSVRHLQRAFQERDTSPTEEIRRLRVELAQTLLTDARYDVLSIEEIAQHSGFGSADDLRRAFRLQQVMAPSQLRSRSRAARRAAESVPFRLTPLSPLTLDSESQRRRA